jgi:serine protease
VEQRDVLNGDATTNDGGGHGTAMAGVAVADTNNANAVAGVGWNTDLAIAKASDADGDFTTVSITSGLNWCGNVGGVSVINMSFGGPGFSDVINEEIQQQNAAGRNLAAAAGNGGPGAAPFYPAAYANVIGVGGSNPDGSLWNMAAEGPEVDLVAPSGGIITTARNDSSRVFPQGTSLASPQVAGVAAILGSKGLPRDGAEGRLLRSATDCGAPGNDDAWGQGFLNADCAVDPSQRGC